MAELLDRDWEAALDKLSAAPNDRPKLRPYQGDANFCIEQAIADRKRVMLAAMATGTGKTFMAVNEIYWLMKSGVARRAIAAQAVPAFSSF